MTISNYPLSGFDLFGESIVLWIGHFIAFNWLVALLSGAACLVMVYIIGLLYRWSWRLTVAVCAIALAFNTITPLVTADPPWLSTLVVVLANLFVSVVVAFRLRVDKGLRSPPKR